MAEYASYGLDDFIDYKEIKDLASQYYQEIQDVYSHIEKFITICYYNNHYNLATQLEERKLRILAIQGALYTISLGKWTKSDIDSIKSIAFDTHIKLSIDLSIITIYHDAKYDGEIKNKVIQTLVQIIQFIDKVGSVKPPSKI